VLPSAMCGSIQKKFVTYSYVKRHFF